MVVVYNIEIKVVSSNVANIFVNNIFVGKETTMLHAKQSFEFNEICDFVSYINDFALVDETNAVLTVINL